MSHPAHLTRRQALGSMLALACTAPQAQTEATGMQKIRASGVLKVAVYKDNAPFSSGPASDLRGLDIAIAQALARQLQLTLVLLPFDAGENMADDLRNMVWKGHYLGYGPADVMLHVPLDKYLLADNRQVLGFAPYLRQVPTLLYDTQVLPKMDGADDLVGLPLAVERGTGSSSVLLGHRNGLLRKQVGVYPSSTEAVMAVLNGKAAAAYVLRAQAEALLAQLPHAPQPGHWALAPLPLSGLPENGWPIGLATKADAKELAQALEQAFASLRSNGELQAIFRQSGVTLTVP